MLGKFLPNSCNFFRVEISFSLISRIPKIEKDNNLAKRRKNVQRKKNQENKIPLKSKKCFDEENFFLTRFIGIQAM